MRKDRDWREASSLSILGFKGEPTGRHGRSHVQSRLHVATALAPVRRRTRVAAATLCQLRIDVPNHPSPAVMVTKLPEAHSSSIVEGANHGNCKMGAGREDADRGLALTRFERQL